MLLCLFLSIWSYGVYAQTPKGVLKPDFQQQKMGVPASAVVSPTYARQPFARRAAGQNRVVTFWLNFEAPSSAPYQLGMHELKVDKRSIDYSDLKRMGITHSNMLANQGGVYYDGTFYCCNGEEAYGLFASWIFHFKEDNDWKLYAMYDPDDPGFVADMVTLNPVTKKAYGTFVTSDGSYDWDLAEVDYKRLERKTIAKHEHRYCAMAFDRQGRWLGISGLGDLYEIDTKTGKETFIGSTGLPVSTSDGAGFYFQSGCYDPATDTFYWGRTDLEGKSGIYAVDPHTAKAELYAELPNYTLISYINVRESYDVDTAPAAVTDLTATTLANGSEVTVNFTLPTRTIAGGALSGQLDYEIAVDGNVQEVTAASAAAGTTVSAKLTLAAGAHRVDVVAKNASGTGILAFTPVFVGYDTPDIPGHANLLVEKRKATLSWQPAQGEFGGNVGDVTYTVTRYPDSQVVASGLTDTTFVDETLPAGHLVKYTYGITPVNTAGSGRENISNGQVGGDAREVPYYVKARADVEEQDFSFVDSNNDGLTWEVSEFWDMIRFSHKSYKNSSLSQQLSDDWMFLPAISLKAGKKYQLEYDEWGTKGFDTSEQMEVKIGKAMSAEAQTQTIASRYEIPKDEAAHRKFTFSVSEDGDYYIGFHVAGVQYEPANDVEIQTIAVVEAVADTAPAAVENLSVLPGEQGSYQATVTFTAPTKTYAGGTLSQIGSVRVYRNNTLIHTFTEVTAGQPLTYTDNTLLASDNGVNQYVVVAANASGDGEVSVKDLFIGVDKPTVEGISGSVSQQNGKLVFEWTPVSTVGDNEGYVDPSKVTYYVYELRGARNYLMGSVTGQTRLECDFDYNSGEQRMMTFTLGTANAAGYLENAIVELGSLVVGESYRLPFSESLESGKDSKYFFWNTTNSNNPLVVATDDSFDDDGGCYQWSGGAAGHYYSVNLGKVSLRGASNPALVFAYKFATVYGSVQVEVQTPDGKVHQEDLLNSGAGVAGDWQIAKVSLEKYLNEDYVLVKLKLESDRPTALVNIDAINVLDMPNYNLGVTLNAAAQVKAGAPADINIVVRNLGDRDISDYTVTLYEGEREVFTQEISADLSTLQRKVVTPDYIPNVFNEGKRVTLRAEVSADRDRTEEDNRFEVEVDVLPSESPQPEHLNGTEQDGAIVLTWAAPADLNATVTEDFEEGFTDFATGGVEQGVKEGILGRGWTLFDGDNSMVNSIDGLVLTSDGEEVNRAAWVVFNTDLNGNAGITPHSGSRFALSLGNTGMSYNWLISPAMTGQSQTVSFFAAEPAGFSSHETIQVLASSTDTDTGAGRNAGYGETTGSFTVLKEFQTTGNGWYKFEVELPEGTKYFALRSASAMATGRFLCVDDITYEVGSGMVLKYNIYDNGQLKSSVDGSSTTYTFQKGVDSQIAITAVYEGGRESAPVYLNVTDGIGSILSTPQNERRIFNLKGQRVKSPMAKGVYVIDGRKVVVK